MRKTKLQFDPKSILGPADHANQVRSAGLHLSQIYGDLNPEYKKVNQPGSGGHVPVMTEEELGFYRAGGFIWETIWSQSFAECIRNLEIVRPGEFKASGIIGSPDNVRLNPWRVIETKCTWKSVRKWDESPIEKYFWIYLVQVKGYCYMVGAREAEIYVMFMNGDYRGSGPVTRAELWEFTEQEIVENWEMLIEHAKRKGWIE